MDGLLIEFDSRSGRRAGDISPKDAGLKCYGWQNLEEEDISLKGYVWRGNLLAGSRALEIRVIEDGRDISQYEGIPGVTILRGNLAINEALDKYFEEYMYAPPVGEVEAHLFVEALKEKGIKISEVDLSEKTLKTLYEEKGIKVIRKIRRFQKLPT